MNCRFIHPGVNDKGNYSLISKPEPFSPNGAPPIGPHPLMPANPWVRTSSLGVYGFCTQLLTPALAEAKIFLLSYFQIHLLDLLFFFLKVVEGNNFLCMFRLMSC